MEGWRRELPEDSAKGLGRRRRRDRVAGRVASGDGMMGEGGENSKEGEGRRLEGGDGLGG